MIFNIFRKKEELPLIHWKDITIAKHKAIVKAYENHTDQFELALALVCAAYGKDEHWLDGLKVSEANDYIKTLAFIGEEPKPSVAKRNYLLGGRRYRLTMNPQEMTTAQYIDFQQLADKSGEQPAEFLSVLLIPKGHKYGDGYDITQVVDDIEQWLSVEDAMGLTAFFFTLLQWSMKRSTRLLKRLKRKAEREGLMTPEQLQVLTEVLEQFESGNGLKQWTL